MVVAGQVHTCNYAGPAARSSPWLARPTKQGEPPWLTPGSTGPLKAAGALAGAMRVRVQYSSWDSTGLGDNTLVLTKTMKREEKEVFKQLFSEVNNRPVSENYIAWMVESRVWSSFKDSAFLYEEVPLRFTGGPYCPKFASTNWNG